MQEATHSRIVPSASFSSARAVRLALIVVLVGRLLLSLWAATIVLALSPPSTSEEIRPFYLGEPVIDEGLPGLLLGPWQRWDTMRYLTIARNGYHPSNSVFPPIFPLAVRAVGAVIGGITGMTTGMANLSASLLISTVALLGSLILFYELTAQELDEGTARRAVLYLVCYPVGFYLFAGYTESLFLLFVLASMWTARRGHFWQAGLLSLPAVLTRHTGWVLVLPFAYEYARQREFDWRRIDWHVAAVGLPALGLLIFMAWRAAMGFPPINEVYEQSWLHEIGFPGQDMLVGLQVLLTGDGHRAGHESLVLDLASLPLLLLITVIAFRRLGWFYGLYCLGLLSFMSLTTSDILPLNSFSRYTIVFFPMFMLLGTAGRRPLLDKLILFSSLVLYFFFSGQFFLWEWVA